MSGLYLSRGMFPQQFFSGTADYIRQVQLPSGAIPWFDGGYCDPWDHVEAAMGLSICGDHRNAERAYDWLAGKQLEDGSWWAAYRDEKVDNDNRWRAVGAIPAGGTQGATALWAGYLYRNVAHL